MLTTLRAIGFGCVALLGLFAVLGLCHVLLSNVMLLWAGLALCSLAFSLLLLYIVFSHDSYRFD